MARHDYEEAFGQRLLGAIGPDSVVWDVGANVGLYTRQFVEAGARSVIAFEPAPESVAILQKEFAGVSRVTVMPVALASQGGTAAFSSYGSSVTNSLVEGTDETRPTVEVRVMRADEAQREFGLDMPTVMKIDVEGFEVDVIRGLGAILDSPSLRHVFVEVHFRALNRRGLDDGPNEMVSRLEKAGFSIDWLDLSHLCAVRR
jgi:FkbM family methyltransferase